MISKWHLEVFKKITPIQRKIIEHPEDESIIDDVYEIIDFFRETNSFADTYKGAFLDVLSAILSRLADKKAIKEILMILTDIQYFLLTQPQFQPHNKSEPKNPKEKLVFIPKEKIPYRRKDGYIPKADVRGGIGVPLFDKSQVLGNVGTNRIYKPVVDVILNHLKQAEKFSVKDIRYILREWYKKHREIAETTINIYANAYIAYFLQTKQIQQVSRNIYRFKKEEVDKTEEIINWIYAKKHSIIEVPKLVEEKKYTEKEIIKAISKLVSLNAVRQLSNDKIQLIKK